MCEKRIGDPEALDRSEQVMDKGNAEMLGSTMNTEEQYRNTEDVPS